MASRMTQYRSVAPALVEHRSAPRHHVVVTHATVRRQGDAPTDAYLRDLSIYGCRIESSLRPEVSDRLWLRFQGSMPIAATVVWSDNDFTGCRFDEAIPRSLVRALTLCID